MAVRGVAAASLRRWGKRLRDRPEEFFYGGVLLSRSRTAGVAAVTSGGGGCFQEKKKVQGARGLKYTWKSAQGLLRDFLLGRKV